MTASAGEPGAWAIAASAKSEIVSVGLSEIDPSWCRPSSRSSEMITLASSGATSHITRSPSGRVEAFWTRITSIAEGVSHSSAWTRSARSGGATILR